MVTSVCRHCGGTISEYQHGWFHADSASIWCPETKADPVLTVDGAPATPAGQWMVEARKAIIHLAAERDEITGETVTRYLHAKGVAAPAEPRLMGSLFLWARNEGLILPTKKFVRATRMVAHRRPMRVWRSARTRGVVVERR